MYLECDIPGKLGKNQKNIERQFTLDERQQHKIFRKKNSIVNIPLSPTAAAEFPSYSSKVNLETEEKIPT